MVVTNNRKIPGWNDIKHRAWTGEEMLYNVLPFDRTQIMQYSLATGTTVRDVADVMQFIGVYDSKGTPIYEGDIVKMDDSNYSYSREYDEGRDGYLYITIPRITELIRDECISYIENAHEWWRSVEVVGNIHVNGDEFRRLIHGFMPNPRR